MTDLAVDGLLSMHATLGRVADVLEADRHDRQWLAAGDWYVQAPAISFPGSAAPYAPPAWGPNTGYCWAVQRVTVTPLAAGDLLTVYRGHSGTDANGQNALFEFSGGAPALATQAWSPGRTGLILMGDESVVFNGTLTSGTQYFVNMDVIQLELGKLPFFLL